MYYYNGLLSPFFERVGRPLILSLVLEKQWVVNNFVKQDFELLEDVLFLIKSCLIGQGTPPRHHSLPVERPIVAVNSGHYWFALWDMHQTGSQHIVH